MKRIIISLVLACFAFSVHAQKDIPAGMRIEVAEIGENDDQYTIFKYKDEDGTTGYYMSLAHRADNLDFLLEGTSLSISDIDEICLWLGADSDEALAALEDLLELLDQDAGTEREFVCRQARGIRLSTEPSSITGVVKKRLLWGKYLSFSFISRDRTMEVSLSKSNVKQLRSSFKIDLKLHPNQ